MMAQMQGVTLWLVGRDLVWVPSQVRQDAVPRHPLLLRSWVLWRQDFDLRQSTLWRGATLTTKEPFRHKAEEWVQGHLLRLFQ